MSRGSTREDTVWRPGPSAIGLAGDLDPWDDGIWIASDPGEFRGVVRGTMMAFTIEFTPVAREHLRSFKKRDQRIIVDAIVDQLTHQPGQPTARRKPLDDNPVAPWELRIGDFRAFYDIHGDDQVVVIVAVGRKDHDRLWIGGEEIEL